MAGIDKTYTDLYSDYIKLKEWAKDKTIKFYTGAIINVKDYIYDWDEEDFTRELPIMNTPTSLDIFLIQNCPFDFVQDRMKAVYPKSTYKEFKEMKFPTDRPSHLKQNRKIKIIQKGNLELLNKGWSSHQNWWLQSKDNSMGFDDDIKVWVMYSDYLPNNTNTSHHKNIKGLIRFLRKQYLPSGIEFELFGRYVDEHFLIKIK